MRTHLFVWHANRCTFFDNSCFHHDPDHDRVTGIEDELGQDLQFARENGDVLEFLPFLLLEFFPVGHKFVEEMVDDVGLEDLDAQGVGQLLGVPFDFYVERQYSSVPGIILFW